ncbi:MAG: hypothetical protein FWE16_04390 [Firmicutes bacterium]|nr:hypothetical protein [Bacillota bacterium]
MAKKKSYYAKDPILTSKQKKAAAALTLLAIGGGTGAVLLSGDSDAAATGSQYEHKIKHAEETQDTLLATKEGFQVARPGGLEIPAVDKLENLDKPDVGSTGMSQTVQSILETKEEAIQRILEAQNDAVQTNDTVLTDTTQTQGDTFIPGSIRVGSSPLACIGNRTAYVEMRDGHVWLFDENGNCLWDLQRQGGHISDWVNVYDRTTNWVYRLFETYETMRAEERSALRASEPSRNPAVAFREANRIESEDTAPSGNLSAAHIAERNIQAPSSHLSAAHIAERNIQNKHAEKSERTETPRTTIRNLEEIGRSVLSILEDKEQEAVGNTSESRRTRDQD